MIINLDQIKELLNSDVTGYRIGQETSVKQQNYDRYKKGLSNFESMPLKTAIELQNFINKESAKMEKFDTHNLLNVFYDEGNGTYDLEFVDGWIKEIPASDHAEAKNDEFYWDDQENINLALKNGEVASEIIFELNDKELQILQFGNSAEKENIVKRRFGSHDYFDYSIEDNQLIVQFYE